MPGSAPSSIGLEERGGGSLLTALTADEKQLLAGLLRKVVLALEPSRD
jgi:hypothetical protein